jgi:hypothetical protein
MEQYLEQIEREIKHIDDFAEKYVPDELARKIFKAYCRTMIKDVVLAVQNMQVNQLTELRNNLFTQNEK